MEPQSPKRNEKGYARLSLPANTVYRLLVFSFRENRMSAQKNWSKSKETRILRCGIHFTSKAENFNSGKEAEIWWFPLKKTRGLVFRDLFFRVLVFRVLRLRS